MRSKMLDLRLKVGNSLIDVDVELTKKYYKEQPLIKEDCSCEDCAFYVDKFSKMPFEIFKTLKIMGVEIAKNLDSEPTGVWCIRNKDGSVEHCQHILKVFGKIVGEDKIVCQKKEYGYEVSSDFVQVSSEEIDIELNLSLVPHALRRN
jgi:hypothetical protein